MCVLKKIVRINRKIIQRVMFTDNVINSKPVVQVILKERMGFRAQGLVQKFLNALKSLSGSAVTLTISGQLLIIKFC